MKKVDYWHHDYHIRWHYTNAQGGKYIHLSKELHGPGQCGSVGGSVVPKTEKLWVQFPVRVHTQAVGSIPSRSTYEKATDPCFSLTSMFLSLSPKSNEKMSSGEDKNIKMNWLCQDAREENSVKDYRANKNKAGSLFYLAWVSPHFWLFIWTLQENLIFSWLLQRYLEIHYRRFGSKIKILIYWYLTHQI